MPDRRRGNRRKAVIYEVTSASAFSLVSFAPTPDLRLFLFPSYSLVKFFLFNLTTARREPAIGPGMYGWPHQTDECSLKMKSSPLHNNLIFTVIASGPGRSLRGRPLEVPSLSLSPLLPVKKDRRCLDVWVVEKGRWKRKKNPEKGRERGREVHST